VEKKRPGEEKVPNVGGKNGGVGGPHGPGRARQRGGGQGAINSLRCYGLHRDLGMLREEGGKTANIDGILRGGHPERNRRERGSHPC